MNVGQSNPNSKVSTVPVTAPTANVTAMYFDQRCASANASASSRRIARQLAINAMNAHATPSGTRMMWNPSVNAICERAQGTGSTAMSALTAGRTGAAVSAKDATEATCGRGLTQPVEHVLTDSDRVCHRGQCRVHRTDAREEARVDHVEVVELVRLAVFVED